MHLSTTFREQKLLHNGSSGSSARRIKKTAATMEPTVTRSSRGVNMMSWSRRWLLISGALLLIVTALLVSPSHGAVIKRESGGISQQELVAEELLATEKPLETKDNEATGEANRIADSISRKLRSKVNEDAVEQEEEGEEQTTAEPFDATVDATETPIPTFQPSINR